MTDRCGGCQGLGAHGRYCPRHPDYHPWKIHAARAEDIGDAIGGSDPGLANRAYALAGLIRAHIADHPWKRPQEPRPLTCECRGGPHGGYTCPGCRVRPLPIHRTEAGYPHCATCDGGGCLDCTDPA